LLSKTGVLGREDCLSEKTASGSLFASSAASLFRTIAPQGKNVKPGGFWFLLTNQKKLVAGPEGLTEKELKV